MTAEGVLRKEYSNSLRDQELLRQDLEALGMQKHVDLGWV